MKDAFLIFAIVLNVGFAGVVFWWLLREYRRSRAATPRRPPEGNEPPASRP